jgi:HK97 gp10 family phage protein
MTFAVNGVGSLEKKIQKTIEATRKRRKAALRKAAYIVAGTAKQLIQRGPKTGRTYGKHTASAPGEPPASDTGNLVSSITVEEINDGQVNVICRAPYAAVLELGTDDGTTIEERPFMRPAAAINKNTVAELMREAHSSQKGGAPWED